MRRLFAMAAVLGLMVAAHPADAERQIRVCADPNSLPLSNEREEGFENAVAEIVAEELGAELQYYWWPNHRGFLRKTMKAGKCDLAMGLPAGYEMAATTQPYYRSTYVFVTRSADALNLHSMTDPRLKELRIGVQLIGDDGVNTPPAHALGRLGIVDNVVGFMVYGDADDPQRQSEPIKALVNGEIDVAAMWGPPAAYYADRAAVPLDVAPITDTERFRPLKFDFAIAMGVLPDNTALREELNAVIDKRGDDITAILRSYDVPLVEAGGEPSSP